MILTFFRTTPLFHKPSVFMEKSEPPLFGKISKTQSPSYKEGVQTMEVFIYDSLVLVKDIPFFSIRIRQQGKRETISLTPLYHFHPLHRHLDISRTITAESSPLHVASSRTRTRNHWFPSTSH